MRFAAAATLGLFAVPAFAESGGEPLSAIDWLSRSLESTAAAPARPEEPPVTESASTPGVVVTPLDGPQGGAVGALPPEVTGLPRDLWARSSEADLLALIGTEQGETLPALRELAVTLMLAEAEPPQEGDGKALFLARVDELLTMGALEAAQALLESGDLLDPKVFRRWFDVTLLRGTESDACEMLGAHPSLAPTLMSRVFCTARNGDWNAAALTLSTARALGDVTAEEDVLLTRFLDPEFAEMEEAAAAPSRPSPLVYRMNEAVGDLMPTNGLPLAFSHADLRDTVSWRAQIEAAERLARQGAVSENVLLDVYTARAPAASGGVWDRAAAIQKLDAAILEEDATAAAEAVAPAWDAMVAAGLEVPFARIYGPLLLDLGLTGRAGALVHRIALLSPAYEEAARAREPADARERIWHAVATGETEGLETPDAPSSAVVSAFDDTAEVPPELASALEDGRTGEAILRAIGLFEQGLDGDHGAVSDALSTLRAAGLEDAARRAALQFLILDARA